MRIVCLDAGKTCVYFRMNRDPDADPIVITAALHVASNVATGMPAHQEAVMGSGIPHQLRKYVEMRG